MRRLSLHAVALLAFLLALVTVGTTGAGEGRDHPSGDHPRSDSPDEERPVARPAASQAPAGRPGNPTRPDRGRSQSHPQQPRPIPLAPLLRLNPPPSPRAIALTFDDGPHPEWTPAVLDLLKLYQVHATFCVIGRQVPEYPHLVRRIAAEGHALCNHTWSHDLGLSVRPTAAIQNQLGGTSRAVVAAGAPAPRLYRAPGGMWSRAVVGQAARLGMVSLGWNVDPQDWAKPGSARIAGRVLDSVSPGAIVLLHDGGGNRRQTVEALRIMLPQLIRRGYQFVLP